MASINSLSGTSNRITGLATGLDTDSMVKELMKAERIPLDKLYQQRQKLEWQRDSYRDMTNLIRGFRDEYFSVLKPQTNILSESSFFKFNTSSSNEQLVTVSGTADAISGSHTIKVRNLATASTTSSAGTVSAPLKGTAPAEFDFTDGKNQFSVVLDGVQKTISLDTGAAAYTDVNDLVNNAADGIQKLINDAFGAGKITVSADGSGVLSFTAASSGSKIVLGDTETNSALSKLKFSSGDSNGLNLNSSLSSLAGRFANNLTFDADNNLKFTINNVEFTFNKSTTLKDMMNTVNTSAAGVTMSYSQLTDSFTLTSKQTGAGNGINIINTGGNFFDADPALSASGIKTGSVSNGIDAVFDLDGVLNITRSDNTFTIDGVKYNLLKADPAVDVTVGVSQDVESVYNNIKSFVDKYNEMIEKINAQLDQPLYRDYQPLTDAQKEGLSDDEIKKWEDKAQSGVLRNDPLLGKFVKDMRSSIFKGIEGVSGIITDIGISTGGWQDKGKLVIDETKLKKAIQNDPNKVKDLFIRESTVKYSTELTSDERTQRYNESGIAQRLNDIITENIRLSRDSRGNKGFLIEKAGVAGVSDASENDNLIVNDIKKTDKRIADLTDILNQKEDNYYKRFSALEAAINKMNQQSAWLSQQFGTNG